MARQVSIAQAKTEFAALVHEAEQGTALTLTRRGKRIAVLIAADEYDRLIANRPGLAAALRNYRARHAEAEGFSDDDIATLRDSSPGRRVAL